MQVLLTAVFASCLAGVRAQAGPYDQCGGGSYSGSTSCTSGYQCTSWNPYYHQCVPAATTSQETPVTSTTTPTSPSISTTASATSTAGATCTGDFASISAADFIDKLNPGWNLGNTLDAIPDEGSWNNEPVVGSTFDMVKAAGFTGVRLPVTWAYHFVSESPDWTVNPEWLQRVSDVIDMITSRDLYALVNVHHDSWIWADVTQPDANVTMIEERFYRLWYQIGAKLACKPNIVAFEPINEPPCDNAEDAAVINNMNRLFLQALSDTGGFNPKRVVTLAGGNSDSVKTSKWFEAPSGFPNPYGIQFHYYSPYDFIFSAWGKTIWGSDSDKAAVANDLQLIRNNFTDVPLMIGEFGASPVNTEPAARWKYINYLMHTAVEHDIARVLWDNGAGWLDRATGIWRDPVGIEMIVETTASTSHSLPDSTTDSSATSQWSSAYIFHQVGTPVTSQSLPFIFNGNTLSSVTDSKGTVLASGSDYTVSEPNITFSESYLSKHLSPSTDPGILEDLTLDFSAGASPIIKLVQWSTPTLSSTSAAASSVNGSDLAIPISWAGIPKPAAVKAMTADGTIAFSEWTKYLGPLQQGRATYNNQWNWDDSHVIITQSAIESVIASGQTTVFTFEFYPRDGGAVNAVNFTLTV